MIKLKIALVFILILISCSCSTQRAHNNQNYLDQSWYINAIEYIHYDHIICRNDIKNFNKFSEILKLRQNAEIELIKSRPPKDHELEEILISNDDSSRQIGLVNIMLRAFYSKN